MASTEMVNHGKGTTTMAFIFDGEPNL